MISNLEEIEKLKNDSLTKPKSLPPPNPRPHHGARGSGIITRDDTPHEQSGCQRKTREPKKGACPDRG